MRQIPHYPGDDGSDRAGDLSIGQILLASLAGILCGLAFLVERCTRRRLVTPAGRCTPSQPRCHRTTSG